MTEYQCEVETDQDTQAVVEKTVDHILQKFDLENAEVEVLITDDRRIQDMNRQFRQIDRPTDVLSFPGVEGERIKPKAIGQYLGSLAISYPRAVSQAEEYGHGVTREIAFLTTHGMLHLLGYDHMEPEEEAEMLAQANAILNELEIRR